MAVDMNTILGLGQDIEFEGKTYRIADDLEFAVQAGFERWLKSQAIKTGMDIAESNPDEADHYRRLFIKDSLAGTYRIEGELSRQAIVGNPEASVQLLYLLLEDGRRKAGKDAPEVSPQLARRMLKDQKTGPWAQAMCMVALGLDPTNALVMATGLVMTRAAVETNQHAGTSIKTMKAELASRQSENSSETSLSFIVNYLDSLGES